VSRRLVSGSVKRSLSARIRHNLLHTFRGRLALLYIGVELATLLFAGLLVYFALTKLVNQSVDDELETQAASVASELERAPFYYWTENVGSFANHYPGSIQLFAANGMIIFSSGPEFFSSGGDEVSNLLANAMQEDVIAFVSTRSLLRSDNLRVIAMPVHRSGKVVAVLMLSRNTNEIHGLFQILFLIGGILGFFSIVVSSGTGFAMARSALKPIDEIRGVASAVAAGDLSRRLTSFSQDEEIRELIDSLNKMFENLESSFLAQKRFTADASHELRLPLTVLKGEIEVALRQPRSGEEYAHLLRMQLEMIGRMQQIVEDLLMLARADAGQLELEQQPIDLSLLLQEVGQQHLTLFAERKVTLEIEVADDLEVVGDESRLERVFYNLLGNASKFAPEGSSVRFVAQGEGGMAVVRVTDRGPGIAPEHHARIFDRFYCSDPARCRKAGGAGLGLAICKQIVEAHKGAIAVESVPGEGASFIVRLPLIGPDPQHLQRVNSFLGGGQQYY